MKPIDELIQTAVKEGDIDKLKAIERDLFSPGEQKLAPFAPALELKPNALKELDDTLDQETLATSGGGLFGFGMDLANRIARAKRQIRFNLKTNGYFDGLIIVSEGDSWFQYPVFLKDIIDQLADDDDKAILSLGEAGMSCPAS